MKKCAGCGSSFQRKQAVYCSRACMLRQQAKRQTQREKEEVQKRAAAFTPHVRQCCRAGCDKSFPVDYYSQGRKYCGRKCAKKNRKNKGKKQRLKNNPAFKLRTRLSSRIREVLRRRGLRKDAPTLRLLGCTAEHFRKHIEDQFDNRMSWDNYGLRGWHLDHIIPLSLFDVGNPKHVDLCCHYQNLRPLWWDENEQKADQLDVSLVDPAFLRRLLDAGVIDV